MIEFWKGRGGGVGEALRILFTSNTKEKYKIKREWVLWKYMYLKDTLVISICKINAGEMLHLRTASHANAQPCFFSSLNINLDDPIKVMRQTGSNLISPLKYSFLH